MKKIAYTFFASLLGMSVAAQPGLQTTHQSQSLGFCSLPPVYALDKDYTGGNIDGGTSEEYSLLNEVYNQLPERETVVWATKKVASGAWWTTKNAAKLAWYAGKGAFWTAWYVGVGTYSDCKAINEARRSVVADCETKKLHCCNCRCQDVVLI